MPMIRRLPIDVVGDVCDSSSAVIPYPRGYGAGRVRDDSFFYSLTLNPKLTRANLKNSISPHGNDFLSEND